MFIGKSSWPITILLLAATVMLGDKLAPHDPLAGILELRLQAPSLQYPLGTDSLGRCQLSRMLAGARKSLGMAALTATSVTVLSLLLGVLSAFGGRHMDFIVSALINIFISFPSLILALAVVGVMGPSFWSAVIAIAWAWWPAETRIVRSLLLTARNRDYVDAAWLSGASLRLILIRHIWPQVGPAIAVRLSLETGAVTLALSALSFLGLGTQPPDPEWGVMLNEARPYLDRAPHLLLGPGLALSASVLGCNWLAESMRKNLDERQAYDW